MEYKPVWSVIACDACKPLKKNPNAEYVNEHGGVRYGIMNPIDCPYDAIRIDNKIFARSRKHMEDDMDFFSHDKFGVTHIEQEFFTPYSEIRCHDCGVPYGFIHHIGCDCEECPKCGDQLISCECGVNVKEDKKMISFLISVPECKVTDTTLCHICGKKAVRGYPLSDRNDNIVDTFWTCASHAGDKKLERQLRRGMAVETIVRNWNK